MRTSGGCPEIFEHLSIRSGEYHYDKMNTGVAYSLLPDARCNPQWYNCANGVTYGTLEQQYEAVLKVLGYNNKRIICEHEWRPYLKKVSNCKALIDKIRFDLHTQQYTFMNQPLEGFVSVNTLPACNRSQDMCMGNTTKRAWEQQLRDIFKAVGEDNVFSVCCPEMTSMHLYANYICGQINLKDGFYVVNGKNTTIEHCMTTRSDCISMQQQYAMLEYTKTLQTDGLCLFNNIIILALLLMGIGMYEFVKRVYYVPNFVKRT